MKSNVNQIVALLQEALVNKAVIRVHYALDDGNVQLVDYSCRNLYIYESKKIFEDVAKHGYKYEIFDKKTNKVVLTSLTAIRHAMNNNKVVVLDWGVSSVRIKTHLDYKLFIENVPTVFDDSIVYIGE